MCVWYVGDVVAGVGACVSGLGGAVRSGRGGSGSVVETWGWGVVAGAGSVCFGWVAGPLVAACVWWGYGVDCVVFVCNARGLGNG